MLRPAIPTAATPAPGAPAQIFGEPLPGRGREGRLEEDAVVIGEQRWRAGDPPEKLRALVKEGPLVLSWGPGLFLAQAALAFQAADDAGQEIWLAHPRGKVGYPLELKDARTFQTWLDLPKPGRIRVVQREDGLEVQTSIGKVPGPDPNGPTLPQLFGTVDVAGLRAALARLRDRFGAVDGICLVPSFGMELDLVADALSGLFVAPGEPEFDPLCLVYPRTLSSPPAPRSGR